VVKEDELARFAREMGLPRGKVLDWFTRMDELMIMNLKALKDLTAVLQGGLPMGMGDITITSGGIAIPAFGVRLEQIIAGNKARSDEAIVPEKMADCRGAIRVVVVIRNEFDVDCGYSIIGNIGNSYTGAIEITSDTATAGTPTLYNLAFEEWQPYIGCVLTPDSNPSSGSADVFVVIQE
jgi:hypothetical protein